jgi:hypothetical protein
MGSGAQTGAAPLPRPGTQQGSGQPFSIAEVFQVITLILVVLVLMLFTDAYRAPEPHYRYGFGILGVLLFALLACLLLGVIHSS